MKNTNFSSPALQKINNDAESVVATHLQALARVSDDIKILEDTLKKAAIPFVFVYVLYTKTTSFSGRSELSYPDAMPYRVNLINCEEHCLVWGRGTKAESRFFYNIYETTDEHHPVYDSEAPSAIEEGPTTLKFSRPVCETKSNFRMQIENDLPIFYKRIIHYLKLGNTKECIVEESDLCCADSTIPWKNSIVGMRGIPK